MLEETRTDQITPNEQLPAAEMQPPGNDREPPEIPENVFVEYQRPTKKNMDISRTEVEIHNLQTLYKYLELNLEKKGYEDALINPDSSYMEEHVKYLQNELSLLISKIRSYYTGYLREIDFHVDTRRRSGLVETVEELLAHRENIEQEVATVNSIEEDSKGGTGVSQNLIIGYRKGFKNGFAAITYNMILNRNGKS